MNKKSIVVGFFALFLFASSLVFFLKSQRETVYNQGRNDAYLGIAKASKGSYPETISEFLHRIAVTSEGKKDFSPSDLHRLEILASDSNPYHRTRAIFQLSYIQTPEARALTIKVAQAQLTDSEWLVRHGALTALRRIKAPEARAAAEQLKNDSNPKVRETVKTILEAS